jgi:hypothetical protein
MVVSGMSPVIKDGKDVKNKDITRIVRALLRRGIKLLKREWD